MNEQIKKLVEQTYLYDTYEMVDGEQQKVYGFTKNNVQKLADMIVQECIRLCDQVDIVGADDCIYNIKEHFGIK